MEMDERDGLPLPVHGTSVRNDSPRDSSFAMSDSQRGICGSPSMTIPVSRRRRRAPLPNLLISFVTLGSSAGLNFTCRLRLQLPNLPIVKVQSTCKMVVWVAIPVRQATIKGFKSFLQTRV
jgi:hypothetical protein